jgi:hypothetical protein
MLKQLGLVLFIVCGFSEATSQKIIEKRLDASRFERLSISSEIINTITIYSEVTNQIKIVTEIRGENHENVMITRLEDNKTLNIGAAYAPYFTPENDKLAAHKVMSVALELIIPNFLDLVLSTSMGSVNLYGNYNSVEVYLENGNCKLNNFLGDAIITTNQGDIWVEAQENVSGRAFSKNGKVLNYLPGSAIYTVVAESRDGDISMLQTK